MPIERSPKGKKSETEDAKREETVVERPPSANQSDTEDEGPFYGFVEKSDKPDDTIRLRLSLSLEQFEEELVELEAESSSSIIPAVKRRIDEMAKRHHELLEELNASKTYINEDATRERAYRSIYRKLTNTMERLCVNGDTISDGKEVKPTQIIIQQHPLPASLPAFNGSYENFPKFKAMFLDIMKRSSDSDIIKIHHLDKSLVGSATGTLNTHLMATLTFEQAWQFVESRLNNPRVIVDEHIKGLLTMPHVRNESAKELRVLLKTCNQYLNGLKNMSQPADGLSKLIITHLLTSRFDPDTRKLWERTLDKGEFPDLDKTLNFLATQCDVLERCKPEVHSKSSKDTRVHVAVPAPRTSSTSTNTTTRCELCSEHHWFDKCAMFTALSADDKITRIQQLSRCINCMGKNHTVDKCKSTYTCRKCKQKHHTLLHKDTSIIASSAPSIISMQNTTTQPTVLLATAIVLVRDKMGKQHPARALLDSGSQSNFISSRLAQLLNMQISSVEIPVIGIGGKTETYVRNKIQTTLHSRCSKYNKTIEFLILKRPAADLPCTNVTFNSEHIPAGITLADPYFYSSGRIDIILGAAHYAYIMKGGRLKVADELPVLQESELGWLISGKVGSTKYNTPIVSSVSITPIDELMQRFFEVEELSNANANWNEEEINCETMFQDTTTRDAEGRYVVRLPVKPDVKALGDSKSMARQRFLALERRLLREPHTRAAYTEFMNEYQQLFHMSLVEPETMAPPIDYFIPHHPVFKSESTTTKCRVVFDASARTTSGYSLNDILMVGPTIQQESLSILLRFRTHKIATIADVEKMYRQVWIHPEDRPLQKILWRESPDQPIKTYQLNTVTYGTASAPFLAVRTLKQIFSDYGHDYPIAAAKQNDFYVDDFVSGADSADDGKRLHNEATKLLAKGGFTLRKWASNNPDILCELDEYQLAILPKDDPHAHISTLGIIWRPKLDNFSIKVYNPEDVSKLTRRTVLSYIARIYDPLGMIDPVKALAKQIMQQIWELKRLDSKNWNWDNELPSDLQRTWLHFQDNLEPLRNLQIPRAVIDTSIHGVQLHVFLRRIRKGLWRLLLHS